MVKKVIVCADDYAQSQTISRGIITLIQKERLSATSCMTNSPHWKMHAAWLKPYQNTVDVGLHFNLTEGHALGDIPGLTVNRKLPAFYTLFRKAFCRALPIKFIEAEWLRQLEAFYQAMGQFPRFIDGHQHIHQFPVVREALFKVYDQYLKHTGCYMRSTWHMPTIAAAPLKCAIIRHSGARYFTKRLATLEIPHNTSFTGVYAFSRAPQYGQFAPVFLRALSAGGLMMCHPGLEAEYSTSDPLRESRYQEYQYFNSDLFDQHLAEAEVVLSVGRDEMIPVTL